MPHSGALAARMLAVMACTAGACAPVSAVPSGWIVVGDAHAILAALSPAHALKDTPLAAMADDAHARLAACSGRAWSTGAELDALARNIVCGDSAELTSLRPAEHAFTLLAPGAGDERSRFDVAVVDGAIQIDARLSADSTASSSALAALSAPEPVARADLFDTRRAFAHLHFKRHGGVSLPAFVPAAAAVATRALLTGEVEVSIPNLGPHNALSPVIALVTRTGIAAREAVSLFNSTMSSQFSAAPTPVSLSLRGSDRQVFCVNDAVLAADFRPCAAAVDDTLVIAFTRPALESALGGAPAAATSGGFVDLTAIRAMDQAIATAHAAPAPPDAGLGRASISIPSPGVWRVRLEPAAPAASP